MNAEPNKLTPSHYELLGVHPDASQEEIKVAWRRKASTLHPDKGDTAELERFKLTRVAYEILSNPKTREEYDLAGTVVDLTDIEDEATAVVAAMFQRGII